MVMVAEVVSATCSLQLAVVALADHSAQLLVVESLQAAFGHQTTVADLASC